MIAHIRQPNQRKPVTPLIRARHMVAETLLSDEPTELRRRVAVRRILLFAGLILLAGAGAFAYFLR